MREISSVAGVERRDGKDGPRIAGYAAVFNRFSVDLGGYVEQVAPTAFTKTIREAEVDGLFNHDPNMILGRTQAETLRLSVDTTGLAYRIRPGNTSVASDVLEWITRGEVTGSSFAFRAVQTDWSETPDGYPLRTLIEVELFDVGPVTTPAYPATVVDAKRSVAYGELAQRAGVSVDEVRSLAGRHELRSLLPGGVGPRQQRTRRLAVPGYSTPI